VRARLLEVAHVQEEVGGSMGLHGASSPVHLSG